MAVALNHVQRDDSDRTKGEWKHCANDAAGRLVCSAACVRLHLRRSVGPVHAASFSLESHKSPRGSQRSSATAPVRSRPAKRPVALERILIAANHDFSGRVYTYFIAGHY
jgi:hypothetical protein